LVVIEESFDDIVDGEEALFGIGQPGFSKCVYKDKHTH